MPTDPDHLLRAILALEALTALLLSASFFGSIWPERNWPVRIICAGLGLVLLYLFIGQIKAYNLGVVFDAVSWLGVAGYAVLLVGLGWFSAREQRTRRGR